MIQTLDLAKISVTSVNKAENLILSTYFVIITNANKCILKLDVGVCYADNPVQINKQRKQDDICKKHYEIGAFQMKKMTNNGLDRKSGEWLDLSHLPNLFSFSTFLTCRYCG